MGTREAQIILKTEEREFASNSGARGNSQPNQAVGAKTGFSLKATRSSSQSRTVVGVLTHCPRAGRIAAMLFSGRLKRSCTDGNTVTETQLRPS